MLAGLHTTTSQTRFANFWRRAVAACLILGLAAAAQGAPALRITALPAYGTSQDIAGEVSGAQITSQTVAFYVLTTGWWTKPTFSNPTAPVRPDGTWTADITTGGNDAFATKIAVFLLPGGVTPPRAQGASALPAALSGMALASLIVDRPAVERVMQMGGYSWRVKRSGGPVGPGPNLFSGDERDIWTDAEGMHLSIVKRNGQWWCTEAVMEQSLGYGTYYFRTRGRLDTLPAYVVAGFFTWDSFAPPPYREIDFEYARWGNPGDPTNAQYVIQPSTTPGQRKRIRVDLTDAVQSLTHALVWTRNRTWFRTWVGDVAMKDLGKVKPAVEWTFTGVTVPTPGRETWRVNFWLSGTPPADDSTTRTMVMTDFRFAPDLNSAPLWTE